MTKVLFVDLFRNYYDQHGLYSLCAVLKQLPEVETRYISTRSFNTAFTYIRGFRPELVLYSCLSPGLPAYIAFDRELKKQGLIDRTPTTLIGGAGPTCHWQLLKDTTFNALCIGEGETALTRFVQNGFQPEKNIIRPGSPFPAEFYPFADLNQLPLPDRSLAYSQDPLLRQMPSKQFFSGRGCPYDCTYCFNHIYREMFKSCGRYIRKKNVAYLINEIQEVRRYYPLRDIIFNDDLFVLDKRWLEEFAEKFPREVGLPFICNARADLIDEQTVKALKQSGCRQVNWSIENGDESLRNGLLKKQLPDSRIYQAAGLLAKHKIPYRIGNLLGLPGETLEQMDRTIEINIRARPTLALANIFVPYPGLELTRYAETHGYCQPRPFQKLPKDFFTATVMEVPLKMKKMVKKRLYLFPIFVKYPLLFRIKALKRALLFLPGFILSPVYEFTYLYRLHCLYLAKAPILYKLRLVLRHLRG